MIIFRPFAIETYQAKCPHCGNVFKFIDFEIEKDDKNRDVVCCPKCKNVQI